MTMVARYPGRCPKCNGEIVPGHEIDWDPQTHKAQHHGKCPKPVRISAQQQRSMDRHAVKPAAPVAIVAGGARRETLKANRKAGYCEDCGEFLPAGKGRLVFCLEDSGCMKHFDYSGHHLYCQDGDGCKERAKALREAQREAAAKRAAELAEKQRHEAEAAAKGTTLLEELTQGLVMSETGAVHTGQGETLARWTEGGTDHTLVRETMDGQTVYVHSIRMFDDHRDHLYAPAEIVHRIWDGYAEKHGILPDAAHDWLSRHRGCVDTAMYEYIAAKTNPVLAK